MLFVCPLLPKVGLLASLLPKLKGELILLLLVLLLVVPNVVVCDEKGEVALEAALPKANP